MLLSALRCNYYYPNRGFTRYSAHNSVYAPLHGEYISKAPNYNYTTLAFASYWESTWVEKRNVDQIPCRTGIKPTSFVSPGEH